MAKLSRSQLQAALNSLAKAQNRVQELMSKISEHCEEVYGFTPSEVDNDLFIDAVGGGCGMSSGLSVEELEASMLECIRMKSRG